MKAIIPSDRTPVPINNVSSDDSKLAANHVLKPLFDIAKQSDSLIASSVGEFIAGYGEFKIPRFIFMGPKGGNDTIRIGLFAALHGNRQDETEVVIEFLQQLEQLPKLAKGFHIYAYPICNPTGFAAGTLGNACGEDLTNHFWRGSAQPEAYYLEREMGVHRFEGVISLHTDDTAGKFQAYSPSYILSQALAKPALEATQKFLPGGASLESSAAYPFSNETVPYPHGFLTDTSELKPAPFEINLGLPGAAPKPSRIHGAIAALSTILDSYLTFSAIRQNI